jgi:hypothetical protein
MVRIEQNIEKNTGIPKITELLKHIQDETKAFFSAWTHKYAFYFAFFYAALLLVRTCKTAPWYQAPAKLAIHSECGEVEDLMGSFDLHTYLIKNTQYYRTEKLL